MTLKECIESSRLKVAMKMGICSANLYITELNYMEICLNMQHHVLHLCVYWLYSVFLEVSICFICMTVFYLCTVEKQLFFYSACRAF